MIVYNKPIKLVLVLQSPVHGMLLKSHVPRDFVHMLPAPDRVCGSSGALSGSAIP